MEYQEISLGEITYEVRRVYTGSRPASDIILDRITQSKPTNPSFDETRSGAV